VTANLSGTSAVSYAPNSAGKQLTRNGTLSGRLSGPSGSNFDLYLQRRAASSMTAPWANVVVSRGSTSTESVDYSAITGYSYRWVVASAKGSGSFLLCTKGL
jgi:hypothetical protein